MRLRFERKTVETRREFVKRSAALGMASAVLKPLTRLGFGAGFEFDPAVFKKFGATLKGRLVLPG